MTNPVPSHPKPPDPEKWDIWVDVDEKLYVFNGIGWELYNSLCRSNIELRGLSLGYAAW